MKDILGMEITEGANVVFAENIGTTANLGTGIVTGFTPKFVAISIDSSSQIKKDPKRVMVVTHQVKYNKENFPEYFI